MSNQPSSREFWTEFDWERELRKDDDRVHTYFQELPRFIDLPREDDLIYKRIQCHEELIPHGGIWPPLNFNQLPDEDPAEQEDRDRNALFDNKDGYSVFRKTGRLVRSYAVLFVMDPSAASEDCVCIMTLLGKIIARIHDTLYLEDGELPALRIALYKRIAADFNAIMGYSRNLIEHTSNGEACAHLGSLDLQVRNIREQVLDLMAKYRHQKREKGGTTSGSADDNIPS